MSQPPGRKGGAVDIEPLESRVLMSVGELIRNSGRRVITLDHGRITDEKVAVPQRAPRVESIFGIGG